MTGTGPLASSLRSSGRVHDMNLRSLSDRVREEGQGCHEQPNGLMLMGGLGLTNISEGSHDQVSSC